MTEMEWYDLIWHKCSRYSYLFFEVQRDWTLNRGKIPFSEYIPVLKYFLRTRDFKLEEVSKIKSEGNVIVIEFKHAGFENTYIIKFTSECMQAFTLVYRQLTEEECYELYENNFAKLSKKYGLEPSDYGKEFTLQNKRYRIVGLKARKQTFGVVAIRLSDNKQTSIRTTAVIDALRKEIK